MVDVVCLGEAMVELSLGAGPDGGAAVGFAGDTLNTAIYLKRAAPELRVSYATQLGQDPLSDQMVAMIESEGIETDLIPRHANRLPGLYAISTDDQGERSFYYWRDRSAAVKCWPKGPCHWTSSTPQGLVYLSAITLAILPEQHRQALLDWLSDFRAGGGQFAFDSNYRPRLWPSQQIAQKWISAFWRQCDIPLPSVDDEMELFDDPSEDAVLERLRSYGLTKGALKRGHLGPVSISGAQGGPFPPAPKVVDSTAAGDSFNAGFLAAKFQGASLADAMMAGHQLASQVVGIKGAIIPKDTTGS